MNSATKIVLINLNNSPFYIKAALFHAGRLYRSSSWGWHEHERQPSLIINSRVQKRFHYYSRKPSSDYNDNRASWNWRQQFKSANDNDVKSKNVETHLKKERIALGLSGSGPLSLEDVKNAYRACALQWHPDHHDDSSKAIAEEKFKACNAAYLSLCDKLMADKE